MQKTNLNLPIGLLLLFTIFTISCGNQIAESNNNLSESEAAVENLPRVDTTLQFTVMITAILEDSKGNFWFGSHGDGLCRYDGKQYTYFTADRGLPNGVVRELSPGLDWSDVRKINGGNQIRSVQEDQQGDIWIMNGEGMACRFDGQVFKVVQPAEERGVLGERSGEEWKREQNYLWIGHGHGLGVYRYDGEELIHLAFPKPYNMNTRDGVSAIYKDKTGRFWFGTMESGIFLYDGKTFTRITGYDEIGICRSVFQDNTGRIWMGNNTIGLSYFEGNTLTNFAEEEGEYNHELKSGCQSLEQDKNGNLWIGTFGDGLWRYDGKALTHYTTDNGLPALIVKTIYKDKNGKLWFGIGEGSVYGFDGEAFYRFDGKEEAK